MNLFQTTVRLFTTVNKIPSVQTLLGVLFFICSIVQGCGGTAELTSLWNNNEVIIDGQAGEWGSHTYYLNNNHITLGIKNDDDFVYLCLMSPEGQFRRQIIALGLTVWLEPDGGQKLGVHYPIGMQRRAGVSPADREHMMEQALQDIEVIGPGSNDRQLFTPLNIPGISVKIGNSQGAVVYEMKIPMKKSKEYPFAVGDDGGKAINLTMETGTFPSSSGEGERRGGGEGRGGRGGRRFRGGDQPAGEAQGNDQQPERSSGGGRPEPLNFSAKIILAHPQRGEIH